VVVVLGNTGTGFRINVMKCRWLAGIVLFFTMMAGWSWADDYIWFWSGSSPYGSTVVKWENSNTYWEYYSGNSYYNDGIPGSSDNAIIYSTDWYHPGVSGTHSVEIQNLVMIGQNYSGSNTSWTQLSVYDSGYFTTSGSLSAITGSVSSAYVSLNNNSSWNNQGDLLLDGRYVITASSGYSAWGELSLYNNSTYTGKNATLGDYGEIYVSGTSRLQLSGSLSVNDGYVGVYGQSVVGTKGVNLPGGNIWLSGSSQWNNDGALVIGTGTNYASLNLSDGASFTSSGPISMASGDNSDAQLGLASSSFTGGSGVTTVASGSESFAWFGLAKSALRFNGDLNAASGGLSDVYLDIFDNSTFGAGDTTLASGTYSYANVNIYNVSQLNVHNLTAASGQYSYAEVTVGKDATLNNRDAEIAYGVGSYARVEVASAGAVWNSSGNVSFASNGGASLRVDDGGVVNVAGTLQVAANAGSQAVLEFGPRGRLNVGELALGAGVINSGSGLILQGNNSIGKITGGKAIDVTIAGTTAFNGKSDYIGSTTIAFRAQAVLNNADSQFAATGAVFNQGTIRFGKGGGANLLTINGDYIGDNGAIYLTSNLNGINTTVDRLSITGDARGTTSVYLSDAGKKGGATSGDGLAVVTVGGNSDAGAFVLNDGRPIYSGMYRYDFQQVGENWYLQGTKDLTVGNAILNTVGAASIAWFTQLDSLNKRLGEVRYQAQKQSLMDYIQNGRKGAEYQVDFWARTYGHQANVNLGINGVNGFTDYLYGIDIGADKAWVLDEHNAVLTGYFIGYGGAQRDFKSNGSEGETSSYYTGIYGTWINDAGWYADLVVKGQYFDNSYDVYGSNSFIDHGSYDNWGAGASLEVGKRFAFRENGFVEPSIQAAYMRIFNGSYDSNVAYVDVSDADILRLWAGMRAGWNFKVGKEGTSALQPYLKGGVVEQISSGGRVQIGGDPEDHWRPNSDGLNYIGGAGLIYQLTDVDQLHLDYEASFGDKYDVPWNLNFGYRHQF
jgi:outer membrane autotransporter protein